MEAGRSKAESVRVAASGRHLDRTGHVVKTGHIIPFLSAKSSRNSAFVPEGVEGGAIGVRGKPRGVYDGADVMIGTARDGSE
jgi:hypothetical protein